MQENKSYDPVNVTNASKHFLSGQLIKFFLSVDPSNVSVFGAPSGLCIQGVSLRF